MNILFLAQQTSVSDTVSTMIQSVDGWSITKASAAGNALALLDENNPKRTEWDIIIANLADFTIAPTQLIRQIQERSPGIPLLVMNSYSQRLLINPLLKAGANGYLQSGVSEQELVDAVKTVASGQQFVLTESTY